MTTTLPFNDLFIIRVYIYHYNIGLSMKISLQ